MSRSAISSRDYASRVKPLFRWRSRGEQARMFDRRTSVPISTANDTPGSIFLALFHHRGESWEANGGIIESLVIRAKLQLQEIDGRASVWLCACFFRICDWIRDDGFQSSDRDRFEGLGSERLSRASLPSPLEAQMFARRSSCEQREGCRQICEKILERRESFRFWYHCCWYYFFP